MTPCRVTDEQIAISGLNKDWNAAMKEVERLRNLMQAMLDQIPIGATITLGGKVLDHDVLSIIRNEIRATVASPTARAPTVLEMVGSLTPEQLENWEDNGNCNAGKDDWDKLREDVGYIGLLIGIPVILILIALVKAFAP